MRDTFFLDTGGLPGVKSNLKPWPALISSDKYCTLGLCEIETMPSKAKSILIVTREICEYNRDVKCV